MKKIFLEMFSLLLFVTHSYADTTVLFEKYGITVGNGKNVWIKVHSIDNYTKCYELLVGGDYTGNASNCSDNINGEWSYYACGKSKRIAKGKPIEIANKIFKECSKKKDYKIGNISKDTLVCTKKSSIKEALSTDFSYFYAEESEKINGKHWKGCMHISKARFKIKNEFKGSIDNFYSYESHGKTFYVRKSLVKIE